MLCNHGTVCNSDPRPFYGFNCFVPIGPNGTLHVGTDWNFQRKPLCISMSSDSPGSSLRSFGSAPRFDIFFLGPIIMSHPCSLQPRPSRISTLRGHFCHNHWNTSWSDDSDPRGFFRLVPGVGGASKIIAAVDAADQFRF